MNNPRIAWLLTSAFYYWQPFLSKFSQLFPETTVFTSRWHGFAPGLKDSFKVEIVGKRKIIAIAKASTGYGNNFTYLPLNVINRLLKLKPHVIFSNSFGIWTILALLFKPLGKWRVVIAYEGSSPSVDFRNLARRLFLRRVMVRAADACITNSQAGQDYLVEILNAERDRVFLHPYEVPSSHALLASSSGDRPPIVPIRRPVFLYVGSIIPRKGLDLLLEACSLLQKQGRRDYTLLVVGDGSQREELENFCQKNNLTAYVQWIGRVDYDHLGSYFQKADVFVFPTLEDTWGVVALEAMVAGKPILCSRWAGACELVVEGENGYCFDPRDRERLAQLMRCFIDDPDLATSMGSKAGKLMSKYTPETAAEFLGKVTSLVLET